MSALRSFGSARGVLRRGFSPIDVGVFLALAVLIYLLLHIGQGLTVSLTAKGVRNISTDPDHLPYYAARSLLRMFIALFFSIAFTFIYGYVAAHSRRAEKILVPILDILQSVPVLGFLTFTVTAFVALFGGNELGLECASIFAIFTAQAWNLTFSFYQSEKTLPRELDELSRSLRLTKWQRFWKIEVPNSAIGLVWNGMLSFGASWFFLVASETISLSSHRYHLPGIGSYVAAAINDANLGDMAAVVGFEIDDLFPIVDSLTILGFATVENGHLLLTERGAAFAAADIQDSKEIFRQAVLERVPLVRRVHRALQHSSDGNLREGFFLDLLHNHYSNDESRAQLDTAIDWARYAELFEYDAGRGELRLPDAVAPSAAA